MENVDMGRTLNTLLVQQEGGVAVITFNRPRQLNAMNMEVMAELEDALLWAARERSVKGVILTGSGEKAFIAGADIVMFRDMDAVTGRDFAIAGERLSRLIEDMPKPVIAAVNGYCLGGGSEVALACDMCIASENAVFGQPEAKYGIMPIWYGTKRLPQIVGMGRAREIIMTCRMVKADEAERIGLVNKVVPLADLMAEAMAMMNAVLANSPLGVAYAKRAMTLNWDLDMEHAGEVERDLGAVLLDGAFPAAEAVFERLFAADVAALSEVPAGGESPKSALQVLAARAFREQPAYRILSQDGPPDAPTFVADDPGRNTACAGS